MIMVEGGWDLNLFPEATSIEAMISKTVFLCERPNLRSCISHYIRRLITLTSLHFPIFLKYVVSR